MNSRTFNAWLRALGYKWVGDEQMVKGFMSEAEAKATISQYEAAGMIRRG